MTNSSRLPARATTASQLREYVNGWRKNRERIALVPTMGALHDGHLALVAEARRLAERVVVSIFVNPAQFAPNEDFTRYPRNVERDHAMLEEQESTDLIYTPLIEEMYPDGVVSDVVPKGPASGLESDFRPHFFAGVAT